jgi:hypothetical protein
MTKITIDRSVVEQALAAMDYMLNNGEWYQAQERAEALRAALAEPVQEPVAGAAKSVHEKAYSEVELAAAYQKGWSDAMLRRSLGPHIIKEGT